MLGGDQGKLRYGPRNGFSAVYEAVRGNLEIVPCFNFGNAHKNIYEGAHTVFYNITSFVPTPVDISNVTLPPFAEELHQNLAQNMHELWAMHKIENGWSFAEVLFPPSPLLRDH